MLAFAALQGRELYRDDRALAEPPPLGRLNEDIVLLRPRLPESTTWLKALTLAGAVLGVAREGLKTPSGRSLRQFAERCEARRKAAADAGADRIAAALARWEPLGATPGSARRETAESAVTLLRLLATRDAVDLVQALADFTPKTSDTALARHLAYAGATLAVLEKDYFFHGLESLQGQGAPEAEALRAEVARARRRRARRPAGSDDRGGRHEGAEDPGAREERATRRRAPHASRRRRKRAGRARSLRRSRRAGERDELRSGAG